MERILVLVAIAAGLALIAISLLMPNPTPRNSSAATFKREAQIELQQNAIRPDRIFVQHGRVKLVIANRDTVLHQIELFDPVEDVVIADKSHIRPGQTVTLWVDLAGGGIGERRYRLYDPIFRNRGMEAVLIVR